MTGSNSMSLALQEMTALNQKVARGEASKGVVEGRQSRSERIRERRGYYGGNKNAGSVFNGSRSEYNTNGGNNGESPIVAAVGTSRIKNSGKGRTNGGSASRSQSHQVMDSPVATSSVNSGGSGGSSGGSGGSRSGSGRNMKSKFCMFHLQGVCRHKDTACAFAHSPEEMRESRSNRPTRTVSPSVSPHVPSGNPFNDVSSWESSPGRSPADAMMAMAHPAGAPGLGTWDAAPEILAAHSLPGVSSEPMFIDLQRDAGCLAAAANSAAASLDPHAANRGYLAYGEDFNMATASPAAATQPRASAQPLAWPTPEASLELLRLQRIAQERQVQQALNTAQLLQQSPLLRAVGDAQIGELSLLLRQLQVDKPLPAPASPIVEQLACLRASLAVAGSWDPSVSGHKTVDNNPLLRAQQSQAAWYAPPVGPPTPTIPPVDTASTYREQETKALLVAAALLQARLPVLPSP